jgi:hypothetical protein
MNRIDAVVKSRRRQKTNEPKACLQAVDEGNEVSWVPLEKKARFSAKYDFMTGDLRMSYGPQRSFSRNYQCARGVGEGQELTILSANCA